MRSAMFATLLGLTACGRIGYDPATDAGSDDGDGDVDDDADVDADPLTPLHQYHLDGDYHDDYGGPDLVPAGGSFVADGYHFEANQGLSVTGAVPAEVYTVDLVFSYDAYSGWHKVLDYKDLATDEGYYTYDDRSQFVVVAGATFADGPVGLVANTMYQMTITRDAAGVVTGYVDGAQAWTFNDLADVATLGTVGGPAHFFIDDNATGGGESKAGTVRRIRIWDRALAAGEIPP